MRQELIPYVDERRKTIRGAYDIGVNFFDVYDLDGACYQYKPMGKHLAPMINKVVTDFSTNGQAKTARAKKPCEKPHKAFWLSSG